MSVKIVYSLKILVASLLQGAVNGCVECSMPRPSSTLYVVSFDLIVNYALYVTVIEPGAQRTATTELLLGF